LQGTGAYCGGLPHSLFAAVLANDQHRLRYILPDHSVIGPGAMNSRSLATKRDSRNLIERLLFRDTLYWLCMYVCM